MGFRSSPPLVSFAMNYSFSRQNTAKTACRVSIGRWAALSTVVCLMAVLSSGCASKLPSMSGMDLMSPSGSMLTGGLGGILGKPQHSRYQMADGSPLNGGLGADMGADGSLSLEAYQRIREAKSNNSVVLQVDGDSSPVRVLPLPTDTKSVFVSELLSQTGVLKKFGRIDAVLYRSSSDSIEGIRMEVKFRDDGLIDPASDYALRPGDRLQVKQRSTGGFQSLVNMALKR